MLFVRLKSRFASISDSQKIPVGASAESALGRQDDAVFRQIRLRGLRWTVNYLLFNNIQLWRVLRDLRQSWAISCSFRNTQSKSVPSGCGNAASSLHL